MSSLSSGRIVCLSGTYDGDYVKQRGDSILPSLSSPKRRDLFNCLKLATGREILVLTTPPKSLQRGPWRRVPPLSTTFNGHRQLFCGNWSVPNFRILFGWISYAAHVLRNTRSGDFIIIDNYIFDQIIAAWVVRIFRKVVFILDYEDAYHLNAAGWEGTLLTLAEKWGRPLIRAATLAQPALASRLPHGVPWEPVPGFFLAPLRRGPRPKDVSVRFLYSGSLDPARGIDLILEALPLLPASGWTLEVTGVGPFTDRIQKLASDARWTPRVRYHGTLSSDALRELSARCDIGLNCQRQSDPVSGVTFPSKIFSYLSAGLAVISSRASNVQTVCENACRYYDKDTPQSLAEVMTEAIRDYDQFASKLDLKHVTANYSPESTAARLRQLLAKAKGEVS